MTTRAKKGKNGKAERKHRLTDRQERFCREVVALGNQAEAYGRVYRRYPSAKVTANKASQEARKQWVRARIEELRQEKAKAVGMTADGAIEMAVAIALADPVEIRAAGTTVADLMKLPLSVRRTIRRLTTKREKGQTAGEAEVVQVECEDRMKALELVGKRLGVFAERVEHNVSDNLGSLLEQIARAGQGKLLPEGSK